MRVSLTARRRLRLDYLSKRERLNATVRVDGLGVQRLFSLDNQNRAQVLSISRSLGEGFEKCFVNDCSPRARVLQVISIIISRQKRVHHSNYRADAGRAEPRPNKFRTI